MVDRVPSLLKLWWIGWRSMITRHRDRRFTDFTSEFCRPRRAYCSPPASLKKQEGRILHTDSHGMMAEGWRPRADRAGTSTKEPTRESRPSRHCLNLPSGWLCPEIPLCTRHLGPTADAAAPQAFATTPFGEGMDVDPATLQARPSGKAPLPQASPSTPRTPKFQQNASSCS